MGCFTRTIPKTKLHFFSPTMKSNVSTISFMTKRNFVYENYESMKTPSKKTSLQNSLDIFIIKVNDNTKRPENIIKETDDLKLGPRSLSGNKR